ncbi:hypothetical protein [Chryseobacterium sp. MMS23-Vi53]|uniref:hypothetical protein n=1 Tax=Chryseobacterium sp. MMS23-Vi53 TaxID=3386644 RepID=UPI0039E739D7
MKKKYVILVMLSSLCTVMHAQVGINTPSPQGILHVDGEKDNPISGVPNATQQSNDVVVTKTGNLGVGIINPNLKMHVVANAANSFRYTLIDAPAGAGSGTVLSLRNISPLATGNMSLLGFSNSGPTGNGSGWGIGTIRTGATITTGAEEDFYMANTGAPGIWSERLRINAVTGNVGIGLGNNVTPTNKLHLKDTADPLKLEGVSQGVTTTDRLLVIDPTGVVKSINTLGGLSIPNPAVFRLETQQTDFLNGVIAGASQVVPMSVVKNTIPGLTYNAATSTITFPVGTYEMMLVYEGDHDAPGCTISSYFIDFPLNTGTQRIHSTASHIQGGLSNHGGSIAYASAIPEGRQWQIRLGRGQSGNCSGSGMKLYARSTQLLVFRVGN